MQLGPLGSKQIIRRIKNLIVEEISLVDKPAIRRKYLLIKRAIQEGALETLEKQREVSSMDFKDTKELENGEVMTFVRDEELALPPDVARTLKLVIGQLSKLLGYKYKAKYEYKKPGKEEEKKMEVESKEIKVEEKKEEKHESTPKVQEPVKIEEAEVSKEVAEVISELGKLLETKDPVEINKEEIDKKIKEALAKLKVDSGGEE